MRRNNLLSPELRKQRQAELGLHFAEVRGSGRSTSLALKLISQAVEQPGVKFLIQDHWGQHSADLCLYNMVMRMCRTLDLQCMHFSPNSDRQLWIMCSRVEY